MQIDHVLEDNTYSLTTNMVKVSVVPTYLEDHSDPCENHFVWAYMVQIENFSQSDVTLRNRHWVITDANGHVQEVAGEGVVGEQPVLRPNEGFRYTSGVSLSTSSGVMGGDYEMVNAENEVFFVDIPTFSLDSPHQISRPN